MSGRAIWRLFLGLALISVVVGCRGRSSKSGTDESPTPAVAQATKVRVAETPAVTAVATALPTTEPTPTAIPVPATSEPTHTAVPTEPASPTSTSTIEPSPTPVPPTAVADTRSASDDSDSTTCIDCHTDKKSLRLLAKEPEHAESLSEGEG